MPLGLTFEQWQPLAIAGVLFRTLRVCPIRLSALEDHREIGFVRVSIHTIAIADYEARDLPGFKCSALLLDQLSELAFHAWFNATTSDSSVHVRLLSLIRFVHFVVFALYYY